ncbi:SRPBCC domain-containing protein [Streptomyces sp. NBC_01381]|uniref:SRPBCC domain-containing protein n=1 Tax=Streptomyces sp. NBC_01381 TaxID=2903845 RepID=UPI0022556D4F|nr:SRPBCC domain-containing protein [Streptomyces sp. NBC_01381]MCX4665566.1 SRPBCC domain-containing protein [Streptomyces sp. NBC_01381]
MEHEVFVPVPADRLRQVLGDPEKVAGAVPGLQRDADEAAAPLSGRLKVRVGGHTITYRGAARVAARGDDGYVVEGEGTEVRGSGSVKISLTVRVVPTDGGARVLFGGTASADGRVAESSPQAVEGAVRRLLERFAAALAPPEEAAAAASPAAEPPEPVAPEVSVFETEVPPSSFDAVDEDDDDDVVAPPAEAAHARRTMIGRSAEEVDHAPPRGRYAPAPAAEAMSTSATLRWAAPAAAVVVASAIVLGRALRKRR